jgi:hypothetical protein
MGIKNSWFDDFEEDVMSNTYRLNKQVTFFGIVAILILTSCASLFNNVPTPAIGTFTQQELNEARRIRNDPRLYGVRLEPEQYAKYLEITDQGNVSSQRLEARKEKP